MKGTQKTVLVIVLLLVIQAYCDLSLPSYTSDILNVGLQQNGIIHVSPETVRDSSIKDLGLFMPDEEYERIEAAYGEPDSDGVRSLNEDADLEETDRILMLPEAVLFQMQMSDSSQMSLPAVRLALNTGIMTKESLLKQVSEKMSGAGDMTDTYLRQIAVSYVASEYKAQGRDLTKIQNHYLLQSMAAAAERIFEFLGEEEEVSEAERPADVADIDGSVTFDHVQFGYRPDKIIIHDFNLDVKPGSMVAIVGPTGAGKTTMVKLLMRFYDVNSGQILVGGHPVTEYSRRELREGFGMVLQDAWLFNGTIMENIRYGRLDATDEEVVAAAKAARADHFIRALPGGYQMELNEEATNVSQGQKQLLTIARALLADNPILILDEATSSVDTRTEHLIQAAMEELMKGRTSFVIAHRLSTIRNADIILVMKDGDIVEQGSHAELLEKNGFYAQLYNSQFEQAV